MRKFKMQISTKTDNQKWRKNVATIHSEKNDHKISKP